MARLYESQRPVGDIDARTCGRQARRPTFGGAAERSRCEAGRCASRKRRRCRESPQRRWIQGQHRDCRCFLARVGLHARRGGHGIGDVTGVIHAAGVSPSQASPVTILKVALYGKLYSGSDADDNPSTIATQRTGYFLAQLMYFIGGLVIASGTMQRRHMRLDARPAGNA